MCASLKTILIGIKFGTNIVCVIWWIWNVDFGVTVTILGWDLKVGLETCTKKIRKY